jgi:hypothetical protein
MANIGDLVPKAGIYTEQGVVTEKRPDGTVVIDTEPLEVNKYHRHTNTSGLTEHEKNQFNAILDQIYSKSDDVEKINDIQTEIDRLKIDPANRNVVQYLRNQQSHLIREARQLPRTFTWDEAKINS